MLENISRKFVDLIHETTGKWASWDPGCKLQVGDFGKINKETAEFEVEGNIYNDLHIYNGDTAIIKLLEDNPPIHAPRENEFIATSSNVARKDLQTGPGAPAPAIGAASLKGQWAFGSKRGALLIMARPRKSYIPPARLLEHLAKVEYLRDLHLVTEVFCTSAFSLYLSNKNNEVITLALLGSAPLPPAPDESLVGQPGTRWWYSNSPGLIRSGQDPHGRDNYVPLYMTKQIRKKTWLRRGLPPPIYNGDDLWDSIEPEWELLDEDGNEDVFEDTIFE